MTSASTVEDEAIGQMNVKKLTNRSATTVEELAIGNETAGILRNHKRGVTEKISETAVDHRSEKTGVILHLAHPAGKIPLLPGEMNQKIVRVHLSKSRALMRQQLKMSTIN